MPRWVIPAVLIGAASFSLGVACTVNTSPATPATDSGADGASNGPAACVASGGQCLLGGGKCAHVGTSDCNPDRNPGGAFCCLDAPDARSSCPALGDAGFTTLSSLPIADLCAESPRLFQWKTTCAGSIVVVRGEGVDCSSVWLFDPTTGDLQATGGGCNVGARCTGGVPGFDFPSACFDGNFSTDVVPLCPDAGGGDSGGNANDANDQNDAADVGTGDAAHA